MAPSKLLLLVSEDEGNSAALSYAEEQLARGTHVTWICSTPSSQTFVELEAACALKNQHMSRLNFLVITRNEQQPFDVLTGQLNQERLGHCVNLLLDPADITDIAVAAGPEKQNLLSKWLTDSVQSRSCMKLPVDASALAQAGETGKTERAAAKNRVQVSVIVQGREFSFDMSRTAGTLLDGAEDAGIDLPFSCRGGVCSTCRALLRHGQVELVENYALEEWELEAGFTLPCQAEPLSARITLDYDQV